MLKPMIDDTDTQPLERSPQPLTSGRAGTSAMSWLKSRLLGNRPVNSNIQVALNEYIEELKNESGQDAASAGNQKELIQNVLKTHDLKVSDVMVPRADILAIEEKATMDDFKTIFAERPFSRIPVYREKLDHVVGTIHIKDIFSCLLSGRTCVIAEIMREPTIVSPSLPLMDMFIMMREDKKHIALVVDEFGGIDGLITLNDVIEAIVGDIEDEFNHDTDPQLSERPDGSIIADARYDIDDFEERFGNVLTAEERDDTDTLGGLVTALAGHVPKRGETLTHSSGMTMEILDADRNKVRRVRLRNLPPKIETDSV